MSDTDEPAGTEGTADGETPSIVIIPEDIAALSFEEARDELTAIVARMESGGVPLEDALSLWERGEALAAHCQRWLDAAAPPEDSADDLIDEEID